MKEKNMSGFKTIDKTFLYSMIFVTVVAILISGFITISYQYRKFDADAENMRVSYMEGRKTMIKSEVERVVDYIEYMKSQTENRLKGQIKSRTYEAFEIAMNIFQQNEGRRTYPEIVEMIKDALRPIRYNDGKGYFFATDLLGTEQLFPDRPELEGQNLLEMKDTQGKFVIKDLIKIAQDRNEGYYQYTWTKPNNSGKDFPKISYIKKFEPLNWLIGTGEYLDDVEAVIKEEILERISKIRFGNDGYIFVVRYDGVTLMNDTQRNLIGENSWELMDSNGVKVIQEQRRAVENPGGGFISYVWNKPSTDKPVPKISFIKGIKNWEWMVGAGVYVDEIEKTIFDKRMLLEKEIKKEIYNMLLVFGSLMLLVGGLSRLISNKMKNSFQTFIDFFEKAASESGKIDPKNISFREFKNLALSANRMVEQRSYAETMLKKSEERFALAMAANKDGLWDWNLDTGDIYYSPGYAVMLGYSSSEIPAHVNSWRNLIHPDDYKNVADALAKCIENKDDSFEEEFRMQTISGEWIWISGRGKVINRDSKGRALRIIGTQTNITKRVHADEDLKKLQTQLSNAVEIANLGHWEYDFVNDLFTFNDQFYNIFHTTIEKVGGYKMSSSEYARCFVHPEDRPVVQKEIQKSIISMDPNFKGKLEHRMLYGDGNIGHILVLYFIEKDASGKTIRSYGVNQDITERKKIEVQLRQVQKMEAIGNLAGGIAHDFNNILFPIIGMAELLLDDLAPGTNEHECVFGKFSPQVSGAAIWSDRSSHSAGNRIKKSYR